MTRPRVVLFDVMGTLLDMAPGERLAVEAVGGRADRAGPWLDLATQHAMALTLAGRYRDHAEVAAATLRMVAAGQGIEVGEAQAERAVESFRAAPAFPDVAPALDRLHAGGYRLAALTNSGRSSLAASLRAAGLDGRLDPALSVEEVGRFKPDGQVYRWAADRVGVDLADCLLAAGHGWDVAGAAWAGMRTAFVARPGRHPFPLAPRPDFAVADLGDLADRLLALG